jgi:hypothetical protein
MDEVRKAAVEFLGAALPEARKARLVPRINSHGRVGTNASPWPEMYPTREIANRTSGPVVDAMRKAYPKRFGEETKFAWRDPQLYAAALLRAVIAYSAVLRVPVTARSKVARDAIEEMDRIILMDGHRFGCLWAVSDVDFTAADTQAVGEVTLIGKSNSPDLAVSRLLPEALWVGDGYPMPGSRHGGMLYASTLTDKHPWMGTTDELGNAIGRVMTALRLATGTTGRPLAVWTGQPSIIHVESPTAHPQPSDFMDPWWRRVAVVGPDEVRGLRELVAVLDRLGPPGAKTLPGVVIAMRWFDRSYRPGPWQDTVLDLATALEACLGVGKEEVSLGLRTRAAQLLAPEDSGEAASIYDDVLDMYNLRSEIAHGSPKLKKSLEELWSERGIERVIPGDAAHALIDRWRDVVRRATAARLLLADKWPLRGDMAVDRVLVQPDARMDWRNTIVSNAAAYGLPVLATAAPPLVDYLHPD